MAWARAHISLTAVAEAPPISSSYWEARPPNMLDRFAPKSLNMLTPEIASPETMPMYCLTGAPSTVGVVTTSIIHSFIGG